MTQSSTALFQLLDRFIPRPQMRGVDYEFNAGEPEQNAWETHLLCVLVTLFSAALVVHGLLYLIPVTVPGIIGVLLLTPILTFLFLHLFGILTAALVAPLKRSRLFHGRFWLWVNTAIAIWMVTCDDWIQWVGWIWLVWTVANGIAWLIQAIGFTNWRRLVILLNVALAPLALIVLIVLEKPWWGVALLFVAHLLFLLPTLIPNHPIFGPVVTTYQPDGQNVWITIDDGPSRRYRSLPRYPRSSRG